MKTRDVSDHVRSTISHNVIKAIVRRGAILAVFVCVLLSVDVFSATLTVNKSFDSNDGVCDFDCSLREAIANADNEDLIMFDQFAFSISNSVELTLGELVIFKKITIYGTNASRISIKRDEFTASPARVFTVQSGGELTLVNATVSGGTAPSDYGGGIFNQGTVTLINTTVSGNSAGGAGGIDNRGTLNATNSTISHNTASYPGGRAEAGGIDNSGTMTLVNCTISNNQAINNGYGATGGGIYNRGNAILRNTTVANNTALADGGGIYSSGVTLNLGNTIVADNSANNSPNIFGTVNSQGYNLIENIVGSITGNTSGNIIGVDPQFDPSGLQNNGGATKTIALQPNSPAADKGNGTIAGISTDQRGFTRPVDNPSIPNAPGGDGSDMGAFEVQGGPVISVNNVSLNEGNSGTTTFNFSISLSAVTNQTVTANFATANGSAVSPSDYQSTSGMISFAAGETMKQVSVSVNGDFSIEPNETFFLNLSNATNGTVSVSNGQGTGTILNDDLAGSFKFSSVNYSVNENEGTATITVNRTGGMGAGAAITFATQNGTAIAGQDYVATSGSLTFGANEFSKVFSISIIDDSIPEPDETVNIGIFNPTLGGTIGSPASAILTIVDDDGCTYSLTPSSLQMPSAGGTGSFNVTTVSGCAWTATSNVTWLAITSGSSGTGNGTVNYSVQANIGVARTGEINVNGQIFTLNQQARPILRAKFDFNGDGRADFTIFRPSTNKWWILYSSDFNYIDKTFAIPGDVIAPADYNGDGKTDIGIFRPSSGDWWYLSSIDNTSQVNVHFGANGDVPRPSDFDGDGKADYIVFRPSNSVWYRLGSTGVVSVTAFGIAGDKPLVGDFDGDGKSDLCIYRPSTGTWWYLSSIDGSQRATQFGISSDTPVPADYDGDGKTDLAVYRPSTGVWYILNSSNGLATIVPFGLAEDKPVPADYDGDGKADIAVFRPASGLWYLLRSTEGFGAINWGISTDTPIPNAYIVP